MTVVYTAIFGDSDSLKPAPAGVRCVCFTDAPGDGERLGWQMQLVDVDGRGRRAARDYKMRPHELFPEATSSIWVDGSIQIRDLSLLLEDAREARIACFSHPDRHTCYEEANEVVRLQIAHPDKVRRAVNEYRRDGFAPSILSTTGLFYRAHTPEVIAFNRMWRAHLCDYGTNDQVHVDYCAWKSGVPITYLRGHYRENPYAWYDGKDHRHRRRPQFKLVAECPPGDYLA